MAVKFDVAEGAFVQDTALAGGLEFLVKGDIENPDLEAITAPAYTSSGLSISSAVLAIDKGQVGSFNVEVRSADIDGTNEVTHISETITLASAGTQGQSLTVDIASIGSNKVVKLYTQYVSGDISSDISVTLS